jgi:hypothetical protein
MAVMLSCDGRDWRAQDSAARRRRNREQEELAVGVGVRQEVQAA